MSEGEQRVAEERPAPQRAPGRRRDSAASSPDLHHRRSRVSPAMATEIKQALDDTIAENETAEYRGWRETDREKNTLQSKTPVTKQISSNKRRQSSEESSPLPSVKLISPQPIPAADRPDGSAELNNSEVIKKRSQWSNEDGAGALSRCESRSSRVTRIVRQIFCCGARFDSNSDDDVSVDKGGM
ncbi:hypothetical protein EVAR_20964_1 [Eumeta japonica]|uniref:Uncharacterized protein n=1 Tax=Eumeta variegata TaxID=151549 RepID=A0A4C1V4V4_EUMVA|nr:hypothetical protein EVAR_20964_1 [Eumeta japonica]